MSGLRRLWRDLFINGLASAVWLPNRVRATLYRMYGIRTETGQISPHCFFGGSEVVIGRETFINYGCFFDTSGSIVIGARCFFGMQVMVCTSTHAIASGRQRAGESYGLDVKIGDGCWIGTRAVILPGIMVGNGCIIAAGAVVTKDCEPHGLYAGVPARRIKELVA